MYQRPRVIRQERGVAMLLVLIAVAVCTILALSFLAAQEPTAAVAANIDRKTQARAIAESALKMAIDYVNEDADWRSDKSSGTWITDAAMDGGTFTLSGTDDVDGDLSNDYSQEVMLSVVATYQGVTHRVSANVSPPIDSMKLVLIIDDASSPNPQDTARQTLAESWGYNVVFFTGDSPQAEYDAHASNAQVFWISEEIWGPHVGTKLRNTAVGVMFEERNLANDFGLVPGSTTNSTFNGTVAEVLDNSHAITDGLSLGSLTVASSATVIGTIEDTLASGVQSLVNTDSHSFVLAVETGATLSFGPAPARRSTFFTGNNFDITSLNTTGLDLLRKTVDWAAGIGAPTPDTPTLLALYEFEQVTVAPDLIGHWKLDEIDSGSKGVMQIGDLLNMRSGTYIDAYDSTDGVYGGSNRYLDMLLTTNATDAEAQSAYTNIVKLDNATLYGDILVGEDADPANVITLSNGATITGTQGVQAANNPAPITYYDEPTGFPANVGNVILNSGGTVTWNSDLHYDDLTITNGTQVHVSGDVKVLVSNEFSLLDGDIVLDPGATLTLWVDQEITIDGGSTINYDTTRASDVMIIQYVEEANDDYDLNLTDGIIVGRIVCADDLDIRRGSEIYGHLMVHDDIYLRNGSIHFDLSVSPAAPYPTGTPTIAVDSSDLANHGSPKADTVGGVTGQIGTAFEFDGIDDYVEIPHDDSYLMQGGTLSVWFKTDKTSGWQGLFSKDSTGYDTGGHFAVFLDGNHIEARIQDTTESHTLYSSSGSITTGQWYHIMFAWGEEGMALYLDGVLVDSNSYTGGLGTTSGGIGNYEPIVLGGHTWNSGDLVATPVEYHFDGALDDLRIYSERLNASQALEIYNGALEPTPYQSKAIIEDTSGFGEPLTLAVEEMDDVTWSDGGITFTGNTQATSLPPATKLHDAIEATGEFSVELLLARASPGGTSSPSRVISYADGSSSHNFMLGQDGAKYEARVRDTATGSNGVLSPEFISSADLNSSGDTHVVLSYKNGVVSVYLDGVLNEKNIAGGILDNWDDAQYLIFGGAYGGGSHWQGTLKRVAIYDQAFNTNQANNVFNGSAPGDGNGDSDGSVQWDEQD